MAGSITQVHGIEVGHAQDRKARTGCTVVLAPAGAVGGLAACGAAPATRELDLLRIDGIAGRVHAVLLTGGSAFGLEAAGGVLSWLAERGIGFDAGVARVPLVPTLSLFDLAVGSAEVRPDARMARSACRAASAQTPRTGSVGAGAGATVGKALGMDFCSPSGVGTASANVGDAVVGALAVSNAFGDLVDSHGGIVAGARDPANPVSFIDSAARLRRGVGPDIEPFANCTFAVVATSARLDRRLAARLAEMAMAGVARAVRPAHTMFDFDAVITLSCGQAEADVTALGCAAADLVRESILLGAQSARD